MKLKQSLLFIFLLAPGLLLSGEIYRTVDELGRVTFTDVPPPEHVDAEPVLLPPPPPPARVRDTEARQRAIQQALDRAQAKRGKREEKRSTKVSEAERALAEAEAELVAAKQIKDEDRQSLAGGGRRIRPEYFARIKQAEAAVAEAKKRLQQARSGR